MKVLRRANELEAEGHEVVHMEVGEPDFPTAPPIVDAGHEALRLGLTKYTDARGAPALRSAIASYYNSDYGLDIDERRIFVTAGGSGALLLTTALLLNPGENLLMSDPGYPCNRHFLTAFAGEPRLVPVSTDNGFQLDAKTVSDNWVGTTRGVLLASPANPTGAVMGIETLQGVSKAVTARNGHLVSDEIYHGLVYSSEEKTSALHVNEHAFVLNSFSKYFGMTGWRLGWLIVPDDAVLDVEKLAQNLFICPSSVAQHAAQAAFTPECREILERQREEFRRRRDFMTPALVELGFSVDGAPDGAFYIYAGIPEGFPDSEAFSEWLLEEHYVAVTPGTDFGVHRANRHVRFSYAQTMARLELGVDRLAIALGRR